MRTVIVQHELPGDLGVVAERRGAVNWVVVAPPLWRTRGRRDALVREVVAELDAQE